MSQKEVTIEIIRPLEGRNTWYNEYVGKKLKATDKWNNYFICNSNDVKEMTGADIYVALIPKENAIIEGENVQAYSDKQMYKYPPKLYVLREARTLIANKNHNRYDRKGAIIDSYFKKGEVFEEMFDKPNNFKGKECGLVFSVNDINKSKIIIEILDEQEEMIDVRETKYYQDNLEKLKKTYVSTQKSIEKQKIKLREFGFLLEIENEEEDKNKR